MNGEHPSYQRLDGFRLGALAAAEATRVRAHLDGCTACAAHVAGGPANGAATPPAWLARVKLAPARRRLFGAWLLWPAFSAVALAALLLWVRPPADDSPRVRAKGAPALRVFVKRGAAVFPWDGRAPVQADDRLRFEVHGAGYQQISVAAVPGAGAAPAVLYSGALGPAPAFLPLSFRVDQRGRQEVVSVILARAPIPPRLHAEAVETRAPPPQGEGELWRQILVFSKDAADAAVRTMQGAPE